MPNSAILRVQIANSHTAPLFSPQAAQDPFLRSLSIGILVTFGLMAAFAGYAWFAPRLRDYRTYRKTRRLHRKLDRERMEGRRL